MSINSWEEELLELTPDSEGKVSPATEILDSVEPEEREVDDVDNENLSSAYPSYPSSSKTAVKRDGSSNNMEPDPRPHLNILFIGHVDAGKSTTCGNILYMTGQVDERTMEKYEKEAKEKNRESWFLAFIMDINEEERAKGKTVEVGRAHFETTDRRFTILDAPGHKSYVPNMISGAAQADIGILIISARKGEFETGFEKGGQTREHAMLAKTLGVNQLVIAINKMDDSTCNWSEKRFKEIEKKLLPFLKSCGYNPAKDLYFIPISGLSGQNLMKHVSDTNFKSYEPNASWYDLNKPTFLQLLNNLDMPPRDENGNLRIPLLDGYKDAGVVALGKIESGTAFANSSVILMPQNMKLKLTGIFLEDDEVCFAKPGENVQLRVLGAEEDQINRGCIICNPSKLCPVVTEFIGRVAVVELLEHRPILTVGYCCILHIHTACEEVLITHILESFDKKSKKRKVNPPFVKGDSMITVRLRLSSPICMEKFDDCPQLGRFTLRDEGKTIAIGKVNEISETV